MRLVKLWLTVGVILLLASPVLAQGAMQSFGFNSGTISGFPADRAVSMTGGGAYALPEFLRAGGSFKCLTDITGGPFAGCQAGEGVRWDGVQVLASTTFKCTGAVTEALKIASTDDDTVVIKADFYRQGDGDVASFTAKMFVSAVDEAGDLTEDQKVWVQGVGCGAATTNFN